MSQILSHFEDDYGVAFSQGDYALAEQTGLMAISASKGSAAWLNRVGLCCQMLGRFDEAMAFYDRAICADPMFVEALLNSALLCAQLGFYPEAEGRMEAAKALDLKVAQSPQKTGASAKATVSFYRKLATDYLKIAESFCDVEDWAQARKELERALEVNEAASLRLRLAQILVCNGEPLAALGELAKIASAYADNSDYHVALAQAQLALRKNDEALVSLSRQSSLETASRTADVLHTLARN